MRNMSAALKAHYAQETTTICTLWKITRKDGNIYGFTDLNKDLEYQSVFYEATTGYTISAIKNTAGLSVDNLELTSALNNVPTAIKDVTFINNDQMTDADIQAGLWDYAFVQIMEVNYEDLSMGHLFLKSGRLGQIKTARNTYNAEMRGITQALQQSTGRIYTPNCVANLGDSNCRIDLATYTFNGSVEELIDQHSWIDTSLNQTNSTYQKTITGATKANPIVISCTDHGLSTGEFVTFSEVIGMTQLNGKTFAVTYLTNNTFSLQSSDGTLYTDYVSGGVITKKIVSEYFKDGVVEWLTGNNAGLKFDIKTYRPNYVHIHDAAVFQIQVGDTYKISAGCDKLASTCHGRFNNIINFYGFNLIPGNDRMITGT
ncbi:MAG: hypothetical protein QG564_1845 [Campylobacterota bacterium]|nr:hypothetical protein [Campylobacterota bacterium]